MLPSETVAFLKCVLPDEGYYCAIIFDVARPRPGIDKPRQIFVETIEELANVLLGADSEGRTVYHACASFKERGSRKRTNVRYIRSLFIDVDAGDRKPYLDAAEAATAVVHFHRLVLLPAPVWVSSGGGVHAYWPLDRDLTVAEWQPYADSLKASCRANGLEIDRARTSDAASILRPPGTHNRKIGEHLVQFDPGNLHRRPVECFTELASARAEPYRQNARITNDTIIGRLATGDSYGTVYADTIADHCLQLAAFRRSGNMDEPTWHARIGVVTFCIDGDLKGHEWSKNDFPNYNHDETQDKLDRTRQLTGATTCAKLNDVCPGVCPSCVHWGKINSPISISDRQAPTRQEPPPKLEFLADTDIPTLPVPPELFAWTNSGQLTHVTEDAHGNVDTFVVTDNPIYLASVQTNELDRTSFSFRFKKYLPKSGWSDLVVDAATLFGAAGIATMFGKGVVIHDSKLFLQYVRHQVDDYHDVTDVETRYDQFGWKNDNQSFLYGTKLYTSVGPVEAIGAKEVSTRAQWLMPKPGGSLPAWTEAADSLFASDMESISTCVLASFAAPLMRFQSENEGGAILHLWSPESGGGKTTAAEGAWTVWGAKEGLSLTNEDTRVSKPITLGTLGNLPVIYDEMGDKDPAVIKQFVIMFTEGRDRMRGMVDGTIRHTKANWQTVCMSMSNRSLVDQLQGDDTDAPGFRVLELEAKLPPNVDKAKGDRLKKILSANAGHAGDAYLRYLMNPDVLTWTKDALAKWTQDVWDMTRLDAPHRFRVRLVGAIATAAAIVTHLGIVHFQTERIVEWLIKQLGGNLQRGTVTGTATSERAVAALGAFMNEHFSEMVVVPDKWRARTHMVPLIKPHNKLSIRYEIATQRVYIAYGIFRDWAVKKGYSPRHTIEMLQKHHVFMGDMRNLTLSAGTDIPGAQVQVIEIDATHPAMSGVVAMVVQQTNAGSNRA